MRWSPATRPSGWVLRAIVSLHILAVIGQPIFAGLYLSGDRDALWLHLAGADAVAAIGYAQLVIAIVVWRRLGVLWPFVVSAAVAAAETLQYYAGMHGPLWLHIPLGVLIVAAVVVQFFAVWMLPLGRREPRSVR